MITVYNPLTRNGQQHIKCNVDRSGCWIVTSHKPDNTGYPRVKYKGKQHSAHRVMYQIVNGSIPEGKWILHCCDNRLCINPAHLYVGDCAQNNKDMVDQKGQARGEKHGRSKLVSWMIPQIRFASSLGYSDKYIADYFNVFPKTIYDIRKGRTWTHIKGAKNA